MKQAATGCRKLAYRWARIKLRTNVITMIESTVGLHPINGSPATVLYGFDREFIDGVRDAMQQGGIGYELPPFQPVAEAATQSNATTQTQRGRPARSHRSAQSPVGALG